MIAILSVYSQGGSGTSGRDVTISKFKVGCGASG